MADAKHTKGPVCIETPMDDLWIVKMNQQSYEWEPLATVALEYETGITKVEARANAALIVEAFNVATETGRTPRQLADQLADMSVAFLAADNRRTELLAAAKQTMDCAQSLNPQMTAAYGALLAAIIKAESGDHARAAVAKAGAA